MRFENLFDTWSRKKINVLQCLFITRRVQQKNLGVAIDPEDTETRSYPQGRPLLAHKDHNHDAAWLKSLQEMFLDGHERGTKIRFGYEFPVFWMMQKRSSNELEPLDLLIIWKKLSPFSRRRGKSSRTFTTTILKLLNKRKIWMKNKHHTFYS